MIKAIKGEFKISQILIILSTVFERLKIEEKTITEELMVIEEKSFLIGKPKTYWATPFDRETGKLGKKETIKTHIWKITENGKKLAIALLGLYKIKW